MSPQTWNKRKQYDKKSKKRENVRIFSLFNFLFFHIFHIFSLFNLFFFCILYIFSLISFIFSISFHNFLPHFQYLFTIQLWFLPYFDESSKCCDIRHGLFNYLCLLCFVFSFISPGFFLCFSCCFLFLISISRYKSTNFLLLLPLPLLLLLHHYCDSVEFPPKTQKT